MTAADLFWIAPALGAAGAGGAVVRHFALQAGARYGPGGRATAVAACNLGGSLVLAWLIALEAGGHLGSATVLVLGSGFCGALTTFSTWVVDAVASRRLGERELVVVAGVDVLGQLLAGVALAYVLVRLL